MPVQLMRLWLSSCVAFLLTFDSPLQGQGFTENARSEGSTRWADFEKLEKAMPRIRQGYWRQEFGKIVVPRITFHQASLEDIINWLNLQIFVATAFSVPREIRFDELVSGDAGAVFRKSPLLDIDFAGSTLLDVFTAAETLSFARFYQRDGKIYVTTVACFGEGWVYRQLGL